MLTMNPRDTVDDGFYNVILSVYDLTTSQFLGKKLIKIEVRSNGRNKQLCPYPNPELCKPLIRSIS